MLSSDILTSLIEVGIGIAGFSSIVVTLARDSITPRIKLVFLQLWIQSAGIITFGALPLLLHAAEIQTESIFTIASFVYGPFLAVAIPVAMYLQREFMDRSAQRIGFGAIAITFPAIVITNALFYGYAWPYIAVLMGGVLSAFLGFFSLISQMWLENEEPKQDV